MKGFLKSKLVFSLIAVVLLAGAIIGPLAGNFIRAHAQAQPTVTLNPTSGPPGTLVIATGTGWVAGSPINVAFDSASLAPFTPIGSSWIHTFRVPSVPTGKQIVVFTQTTPTSAITVVVTFTVTPRQQLFILLQGINTSLSQDQITAGNKPSFDQSNGITHALRTNFPGSTILSYSYNGVDSQGNLKPYDCDVTFTNSLIVDILNLESEITSFLSTHPNTDVYLIGHSLGGVVAFGYLAFLRGFRFSLPNGGKLAGVITLDSPIGGISDNDGYIADIISFARSTFGCPFLSTFIGELKPLTSVEELVKIFDTAPDSHPQGANASLKQVLFRGKKLTNEQLASEAAHAGIPVLTIGNLHDFLWDTADCSLLGNHVNFLSTQWVMDEAPMSISVYGRDIKEGDSCSGLGTVTVGFLNNLNHFKVLTNSQVVEAILQFLPSGGVPDKLPVAPINPPNF